MEILSLISIYCGGVLSLLMGIFHTQFFKLFKWKKELEKISETNKNIIYTIHIALLLLFFGIAVISLLYAKELSLCIGISFCINLMYAVFWLWRTIWQISYFKPDKNSKLLPLHYILIVYFSLLFFTYVLPVILKLVLMI
jgi:hypothetical protein